VIQFGFVNAVQQGSEGVLGPAVSKEHYHGAPGCKVVTTGTGAPRHGQPGASYRNIVRAGFEPQYVRANYLSSPEADTSGTSP
jgi:hypothetical protein